MAILLSQRRAFREAELLDYLGRLGEAPSPAALTLALHDIAGRVRDDSLYPFTLATEATSWEFVGKNEELAVLFSNFRFEVEEPLTERETIFMVYMLYYDPYSGKSKTELSRIIGFDVDPEVASLKERGFICAVDKRNGKAWHPTNRYLRYLGCQTVEDLPRLLPDYQQVAEFVKANVLQTTGRAPDDPQFQRERVLATGLGSTLSKERRRRSHHVDGLLLQSPAAAPSGTTPSEVPPG